MGYSEEEAELKLDVIWMGNIQIDARKKGNNIPGKKCDMNVVRTWRKPYNPKYKMDIVGCGR